MKKEKNNMPQIKPPTQPQRPNYIDEMPEKFEKLDEIYRGMEGKRDYSLHFKWVMGVATAGLLAFLAWVKLSN